MLRVDGAQDGGGGSGDTISHSLTLVQRLEALLVQGNGSDVSLRVETPCLFWATVETWKCNMAAPVKGGPLPM